MRSVQRDQRAALATFHDTYDLRRAMWAEHQRKLKEARQRQAVRQNQSEPMSSSLAEIIQPATEVEHVGVSHA